MDIARLRQLYGRLQGIRQLTFVQTSVSKEVGDDYNSIVSDISTAVDEDLGSFLLQGNFWYRDNRENLMCSSNTIRDKLLQFVSYLEYGYNLSQHVIEIGSIYNSIADEELKSRCSDILSSPGNFDRVINQATLVLEDRIRKKSGLTDDYGVDLVNRAISSDYSKSVLQVSDDSSEHEGISHICRGIVLSFRNPTHHKISDSITRADALKVCAFIDKLLQIIDAARKR